MKFLRLPLFAFLLLFASFVAARSDAQGAPTTQVELLIQEGLKLRRSGDDAGALAKFKQAATIERSGRTLAQIALAEQALGRWMEAEAHLEEALAITDDPWITRNRPLLDSARDEIDKHLGSLEVSSNVRGATIRLNGVDRGRLPLTQPLRVPLGMLTVEVLAEGHFPLLRNVLIGDGGRAREIMDLVPVPARIEPTPQNAAVTRVDQQALPIAEPVSPWQKTYGVGALIGAGAFLALGGVSSVLQWLNREEAREPQNNCYSNSTEGRCAGLAAANRGHGTRAIVGYVGAAVLAATGGTMLWISPSSTSASDVGLSFNMRRRF